MTALNTQRFLAATAWVSISLVTACATGTDGIVEIGPDTYMVGGLGRFTDYSSSAVKARLYQDAAKHCAGKNKVMVPVNSVGQDSGFGTYASAEVQFRCVAASSASR